VKSSKFVDALQKRYVELQGRAEAPAPPPAAPEPPTAGDRLF
jgi:hypothetical protein